MTDCLWDLLFPCINISEDESNADRAHDTGMRATVYTAHP